MRDDPHQLSRSLFFAFHAVKNNHLVVCIVVILVKLVKISLCKQHRHDDWLLQYSQCPLKVLSGSFAFTFAFWFFRFHPQIWQSWSHYIKNQFIVVSCPPPPPPPPEHTHTHTQLQCHQKWTKAKGLKIFQSLCCPLT